jgi:hypothetical protein
MDDAHTSVRRFSSNTPSSECNRLSFANAALMQAGRGEMHYLSGSKLWFGIVNRPGSLSVVIK